MNPLTPERLAAIKARCEALRESSYPMRFDPLLSKDIPDLIAEVERLRKLVKSAHREGFAAIEGFAKYDAEGKLWELSETRKALETP